MTCKIWDRAVFYRVVHIPNALYKMAIKGENTDSVGRCSVFYCNQAEVCSCTNVQFCFGGRCTT